MAKEKMLLWTGTVLCLAYLLPNHYSPWLSYHQEISAAFAFAPLLAWACTKAAPIPNVTYGAFALALVPVAQLATGHLHFPTDGWMSCLYLLGFGLSAYAGALCEKHFPQLQQSRQRFNPVESLWIAILVAALFSAVIALHQWLLPAHQGIFIAEVPPRGRPFANLAQPNQLATLLLLGIAGLVYLWEGRQLKSTLAMVAAFLLLWALVMTGSRSVLLALMWLVPGYALLRKRCNLRTAPSAVIAAVAFYLAAIWLWPLLSDLLLLDSGANTALERMHTPGVRSLIWLSMLDAIGRAPWFGYGWGQVSIAQIAVTLDHPPTHLLLESAHNLLLDLALWNGLPIALATTAGLIIWFLHQLHRCNSPKRWATLMGISVVFNHTMVEFPLNYAYFLLPIGFFMGAMSNPVTGKCALKNKLFSVRTQYSTIIATGAIAAALTAVVAIEYFPIESDWSLMRFQQAKIGNSAATEPPQALILTSLVQFLKFSRTEAEPDMSSAELEAMRRASERFAYAAPMFKYALAQALNGQTHNALLTLEKMCSMQPQEICHKAQSQWEILSKGAHPELTKIKFRHIPEDQ
ncbi:Wzy polymerase domain-containing protein [Acidovorax sp. LjRoot117]